MAKVDNKVEQNTVEVPVESSQAPGQGAEPVQLTIADLQQLAKIVELASRRGAFHAVEFTDIGKAYNKLASFLTWVDSEEAKKQTK